MCTYATRRSVRAGEEWKICVARLGESRPEKGGGTKARDGKGERKGEEDPN